MSDVDVLAGFYDEQTDEQKASQQAATDEAASEKSQNLKVSGTYRMVANTFTYEKDNKRVIFPRLEVSDKKKVLMLVVSLEVVDGTPEAPKGSSTLTNIVLSPAKGAGIKKIQSTVSMMKPKIVALTGESKIQLSKEWVAEFLTVQYDIDDAGKATLVKDHKMKQEVMVELEDDEYKNKPTLNVVSIRKALPGEKSRSNKPVSDEVTLADGGVENTINPEGALVENTSPAPVEPGVVADDF